MTEAQLPVDKSPVDAGVDVFGVQLLDEYPPPAPRYLWRQQMFFLGDEKIALVREQCSVGVEEAERTSTEPWTPAFGLCDGVGGAIRVGRTPTLLAGEVSDPEGRL